MYPVAPVRRIRVAVILTYLNLMRIELLGRGLNEAGIAVGMSTYSIKSEILGFSKLYIYSLTHRL
jgi:hypothetical protein